MPHGPLRGALHHEVDDRRVRRAQRGAVERLRRGRDGAEPRGPSSSALRGKLAEATGIPFSSAQDKFAALSAHDEVVAFSAALRTCPSAMSKSPLATRMPSSTFSATPPLTARSMLALSVPRLVPLAADSVTVRYQFVDCRWQLGDPERGRELYSEGVDNDGDGFGDVNAVQPEVTCAPPANHVLNRDDCDDADPAAVEEDHGRCGRGSTSHGGAAQWPAHPVRAHRRHDVVHVLGGALREHHSHFGELTVTVARDEIVDRLESDMRRAKAFLKNALGEFKFLFPNQHDVYLHDTPSREKARALKEFGSDGGTDLAAGGREARFPVSPE